VAYDSWLDNGDEVLFHEYGHAWSLYYAYMVQQDSTFTSYLKARGIYGDSRINTTKPWTDREMIAEDYRQLFASPNAAAYPQANTDIPPASQVPGLKQWLQTTFTQPPASSGSGSGSNSGGSTGTSTSPTVAISGLSVNPQPVSKSGTVAFSLSMPATTTVKITSGGTTVRTLLSAASKPAGSASVLWDRKNDAGQRVKTGSYVASVTAVDQYGHTVTSTTSVSVN